MGIARSHLSGQKFLEPLQLVGCGLRGEAFQLDAGLRAFDASRPVQAQQLDLLFRCPLASALALCVETCAHLRAFAHADTRDVLPVLSLQVAP